MFQSVPWDRINNAFPCDVIQCIFRKESSRDVPMKTCSVKMQNIYGRAPILKCDFNKVSMKFYWNQTTAWVLFCKCSAYLSNTFSQEHLWRTAYDILYRFGNFERRWHLTFLFFRTIYHRQLICKIYSMRS